MGVDAPNATLCCLATYAPTESDRLFGCTSRHTIAHRRATFPYRSATRLASVYRPPMYVAQFILGCTIDCIAVDHPAKPSTRVVPKNDSTIRFIRPTGAPR